MHSSADLMINALTGVLKNNSLKKELLAVKMGNGWGIPGKNRLTTQGFWFNIKP